MVLVVQVHLLEELMVVIHQYQEQELQQLHLLVVVVVEVIYLHHK